MPVTTTCVESEGGKLPDTRMTMGIDKRAAIVACHAAAFLVLVVAGCNQSSLESQVSGVVTLDGNSIGPGMIVFAPIGGGKPAIGAIDDGGDYFLNTSRELGITPGKYRISLSIREVPQNLQRSDQPPPGKSLIPAKYEQAATSGLEYDVVPGSNTIDIELTSS